MLAVLFTSWLPFLSLRHPAGLLNLLVWLGVIQTNSFFRSPDWKGWRTPGGHRVWYDYFVLIVLLRCLRTSRSRRSHCLGVMNIASLPASLVSTPAESLHHLSVKEAFLNPLPFISVLLHLF